MQAAMPFSENMQKKIIGMAALLLTGASITPANLQAVQMISHRTVNIAEGIPSSYDYQKQLVPPARVTDPELTKIKVKKKVQQLQANTQVPIQVEEPKVKAQAKTEVQAQAQAEAQAQAQVENTRGTNPKALELSEEAAAKRSSIVASVLSWQGVPYRWGGRTRSGIDCSALVQRVFSEQGISLPRTSYDQFRQGVGVPRSKLELGDLVFFNTAGSGASHVGIYLGDNNFISATRNCVEIQSLDCSYWAGNYRGSRRILM